MSERSERKRLSVGQQKSPEQNGVSSPRYLSPEELFTKAVDQFEPHLACASSPEQRSEWEQELAIDVADRVTGVRVNNVDVVSLDFAHTEGSVDPLIKAYIASPKTRIVVPEYFEPDLKGNNKLRSRIVALNDRFESRGGDTYAARLSYAQEIEQVCTETDKPVASLDIANKNAYMFARDGFRGITSLASYVESFAGVKPEWVTYASLLPAFAWMGNFVYQKKFDKGIFNKEEISKFERFVLDYEQARRLYLAKGIEKLTETLPHDSQVVVVYPKAHSLRMQDTLVNPKPSDAFKSGVYKTFAPYLDYSLREWQWGNFEGDLHGDHWQQVAERKL